MSTSPLLVTTSASATSPRYTLLVAQQQADVWAHVRAVQRLRHRVFAGEMGAVLHTPEPGLDIDDYDAHCDHLVVREDSTGEIVGTYRLMQSVPRTLPLRAPLGWGLDDLPRSCGYDADAA